MKKFFRAMAAALAAFALVLSAVSCKNNDDEKDESVTMVFTKSNVVKLTVSGYQNSAVFVSEKVVFDGEVCRFCLGILSNSSGVSETGAWQFGMLKDPDAALSANTQCVYLYKGDFLDVGGESSMNRQAIRAKDGSWKVSQKSAWKTLDTSKTNITFTLTSGDVEELRSVWGN